MKRSLIILASAFALVSCTKDFLDEATGFSTAMDNTIEVKAMVGSDVTTRATAALPEQGNTEELTSFILSGINGSSSFTDKVFTKANGKYTTGTAPYWSSGKYTFIGWANNNESKKGSEILTDYSQSMSKVSGSYSIGAYVYDGSNNPAQQDDPVLAINYTEKPENSNLVSLTFQHLLSRVSVNLYAPLFTANTVCLLDFGFDGVGTAGTFTCNIPAADNDATSLSSTANAFPAACWTNVTEGNAGQFASGDSDSNTHYWWNEDAVTVENNSTIIPQSISGSGKFAPAPWLNVIPGSSIADNLQVRFKVLEGNTWTVYRAKVSLSGLTVGNETLTSYKPGNQYVYNVRLVGQNSDDADEEKARIEVVGVEVQAWNSTSLTEQNSSNIGKGKSIQDLIDEIEAGTGYGIITLSEDVTLYDAVKLSSKSKDVTIDLAGYDITANSGLEKMFDVQSGAKLTVIDSGRTVSDATEYGTVTGAEGKTIFNVASTGDLTIASGNYTVSGTSTAGGVAINNAGTVQVTGGTFTADSNSSASIFSGSTTGILAGGSYVGYVPTMGNGGTVKSDCVMIETSTSKYQIVQNGEAFKATAGVDTEVTAD